MVTSRFSTETIGLQAIGCGVFFQLKGAADENKGAPVVKDGLMVSYTAPPRNHAYMLAGRKRRISRINCTVSKKGPLSIPD